MNAPASADQVRSARLVTEAEWRAHRLDAMAAGADLARAAGGVPAVLISYQQQLLATTARHAVTVVEKSRRTGVTWAAGADAVLTAASNKAAGGMDVLYIGYNLDMAREFIDVCAMWGRSFESAVEASGAQEFMFDDGADRSIAAFRIRFASGFEIVALASRPRSLRGRQGYVIIDEAAFHDDLDGVLQAAMALLIWGGKVLIISTHFGAENPFNRLVTSIRGGDKPYALMRIDFDDALKGGLYERISLVKGQEWSVEAEAKWRAEIVAFYGEAADEELFCVPSESGGAFLPAPLIEARARPGIPILRLRKDSAFTHWPEHLRRADIDDWLKGHVDPVLRELDAALPHYAGGDYGRVSDLSVWWILARQRTTRLTTAFVVELRNLPFDAQKQIQSHILKRLPRFVAFNGDATGLGAALAEAAAQEFGQGVAEETKLSVEWYRENTQPLKSAFESDMIDIPADADIHSDLKLIEVKNGVAHVPKLKSGVKKDRHGDAAVALLLAHYASRRKAAHYGYESEATLDELRRAALAPRAEDDDDLPRPRRALP
jgi:phage FluMu gp28-like protein